MISSVFRCNRAIFLSVSRSAIFRSIDHSSQKIAQKRFFSLRPCLRQLPKQRFDPKTLHENPLSQALAGGGFRRPQLRNRKDLHEGDGLKPDEWTLIYNNSGTIWLFTMVMLYSSITLILFAKGGQELDAQEKRLRAAGKAKTFLKLFNRDAVLYLLGSAAVFATLTRFRRCWVVRIYEKNLPNQSKPPAPIVVEQGGQTKTPVPVRQYCIVWVNTIFRRRLYFYNSAETERAGEYSTMVTNIYGNFLARRRSWAVFHHYFEDHMDYYRVRGKKISAGGKFVA